MIIKLEKEELREEKLGNKGKFLLQMKKQGFDVPGGFILDSDTYDEVISKNGLEDKIREILDGLAPNNCDEISEKISKLFDNALIPEDILSEINAVAKDESLYAIRSSGNKEDLDEYSFAGQYETFLNVAKSDLEKKIIACYRSMFGKVSLQYIANRNIDPLSMKMSVVIQEMVDADNSGICFTIDPISGND
ncbi:MAG: phosphoenolpyruvate synthase, partial [Lachnospiraceae bacterium]|nr:phosphoenolpyruvate synthase [Lachnospiraceae bacterium]